MGYTHYWGRDGSNLGSAEMFGRLALDAKKIIAQAEREGIRICNGFGRGEPDFNEAFFALNGNTDAILPDGRDEAHEGFVWFGTPTFSVWEIGQTHTFDFCKTAHKPYDAVITAILIRAKDIYGDCLDVSSDGVWSEWQTGRELYERVFGEVAKCPFSVLKQFSEKLR